MTSKADKKAGDKTQGKFKASAKILEQQMAGKILILDGAMGTMLQQKGLTAEDFGGSELEGCNEILNLTRPDIILGIHEAYLEAGADIIETNSFGGTRIVLSEYNLEDRDIEINKTAASLAAEAATKWSTREKPRFVAGSMGPTTKMLALTAGITFQEMEDAYCRQALGLLEGGADLLLIETCQDTLNVKAAGRGIKRAFTKSGMQVPIIISCTIEESGTMLAGQNIEAFYISVKHLKPIAVGLNCGSGAELMTDHLRTLASIASCAVSCYPNAGLPDEEGVYRETPQEFARKLARFAQSGWLNIAGGCCGTTNLHIKALADALESLPSRTTRRQERSSVSGIEALWPEEDNRPLLVGERSNVIGSRMFKDLITAGKWEEGSEIARAQVKKGAQVVDICVANPDRDELKDMLAFLPHVVNKVKVPLMLDSTDPKVIEAGLRLIQGKAIVNSINLENGPERFDKVVPLIRKYGAAVVVGVIDEQGMALTRERKLAVAERSYDLLVHHYGLLASDIIFDPLTFPVGTGDAKYLGSAVETIEGLRLIKSRLPECKTILGISNVSFGLPPAGREVLNAVFVYLNTLAGLDYAIVNAEKIKRYATIPKEEKELAENLLLNTSGSTLKDFTDYYRGKKEEEIKQVFLLSLEERLAGYIIEGSRAGLENDIKEALTKYRPLEIINGPLMQGMDEVGRLFNQNQLIVAEVLQSAEVMKAAVDLLSPYLEKAEEAVKGKILLATVKGDVHDIGKNLVEIILVNNGYQVVNLGVKVSSEQLINASKIEKPDAIGLSGLLVKSVQQMLLSAQDLREAGIDIPLLLGGAALSRKFTEEKIAPEYRGAVFYARDAMDCLGFLNSIRVKKEKHAEKTEDTIKSRVYPVPERLSAAGNNVIDREVYSDSKLEGSLEQSESRTSEVYGVSEARTYKPQIIERQVILNQPLSEIIPYLNKDRLLRRYLGVNKTAGNKIEAKTEKLSIEQFQNKTADFQKLLGEFLAEIEEQKLVTANSVFAFYSTCSQGNSIYILNPEDKNIILEEFTFPRQSGEDGLCLADFIRPREEGLTDYIGMFAVTTGLGIREQAERLRIRGEYLKSYLLQGLALELAEAFAELIHSKMRRLWGLPEKRDSRTGKSPTGKYQGIRVSPGYPVCPDLKDQSKIFRLLKPEEAGIVLTEGLMMDPEASITALVFANPKAKIFNIR